MQLYNGLHFTFLHKSKPLVDLYIVHTVTYTTLPLLTSVRCSSSQMRSDSICLARIGVLGFEGHTPPPPMNGGKGHC